MVLAAVIAWLSVAPDVGVALPLVAGTRGRRLSTSLLRSVAGRLASRSSVPVLLGPPANQR